MRRRTSLEAALAAKPKRQRHPLGFTTSAETPRIWPYGMHWEEAVEWWGAIGQAKKAAAGNRDRRKAYQHGRAVFPAAPVQISSRKDLKEALRNVRPGSRDNVLRISAKKAASQPGVDPSAGGNTATGQKMKLQSPMVITGQILNVTESNIGEGDKASKMYLCTFCDKTTPVQFRARTLFCIFIMADRMARIFGADPFAAVDSDITVIAQEFGSYNDFTKVKGELIRGKATEEQMKALLAPKDAPLPTKPSKKEETK